MHLSSHLHRKLRLLAIGALVISALAASPALAKGPAPSGQCWVTPDQVLNGGTTYTVEGSGFTPGMLVDAFITDAYYGRWLMGQVGADGTFSMSDGTAFQLLGQKNVSIYNPMARNLKVLAQCSFNVYW